MVNKYEYVLHDGRLGNSESYKGMCLKIIIHSIKPLPNESPINGAGKDILHNKLIRAGLEKYKYKRMQAILINAESGDYPMEAAENSSSVPMRIDFEQSRISAITSNYSSLNGVFRKMDLSEQHQKQKE
jgi:hypothetical protein